ARLVDDIIAGRTPAAGTVCITFDDGYLDNLTVAAPILEKHGLPATLFLATGYIERAETQWSDRLYWAFSQATSQSLRASAHRRMHAQLLAASRDGRIALLAEIERRLAP